MVPAALLLALTPALAADTTFILEVEGADTVAAEVWVATADGVRGRIVVRRPALREAIYTIRNGPDGLPAVVTAEWRLHAEDGVTVETAFTATRSGSMLRMSNPAGTVTGEFPIPADAVPMVGRRPIAYGLLEILLRATPADGERTVQLLVAGAPEPVEARLIRAGSAFRIEASGLRVEATLEADAVASVTSRVIGGGALRTFVATRGPRFDIARFLARAD